MNLSENSEKSLTENSCYSNKGLMTTRQVAEQLNTSSKVILENAKKCLPNKKIANGKPTYWNEAEITILIETLKNNQPNQNTFTGAVKAVNTALTPALKIKKAMELMQEGYEEELANLKAINQEQKKEIEELTPDAESWRAFADSDGTFSVTNVAKCLGLKRDDVFEFLKLRGYIMRVQSQNPDKKGKYQGTALGVERGYIKNYVFTNDKISNIQFHLTPKGMQKVEKAFLIDKPAQAEKERINKLCKEAERTMKPFSCGKAE